MPPVLPIMAAPQSTTGTRRGTSATAATAMGTKTVRATAATLTATLSALRGMGTLAWATTRTSTGPAATKTTAAASPGSGS